MALEKFNKTKKCYGCVSCKNNCPMEAITFKVDDKGNSYPEVDKNKCIECKICDKFCIINDANNVCNKNQQYYAFVNKNQQEIVRSSSGGAFLAILNYFFEIKESIVVYGVELKYNPKVYAEHTRVTTYEEAKRFCGSKYVHSDMSVIYNNILEDIQQEKFVIISGLPCQISAVKKFLRGKRVSEDNIFFIDLICHGTGGQQFFDDFISYLEKKYKSKIIEYKFRDKNQSWKGYPSYVKFENGKELKNTLILRNFPIIYLKGYLMKETCFNCQYSKVEREGDITLGDFWGIEKVKSTIDYNKGVSLIIANSLESKKVLNFLNNKGELYEIPIEISLKYQNNLVKGHEKPIDYQSFWKCYENSGIEKIFQEYGSNNIKYKIRYYLKKMAILLNIYK